MASTSRENSHPLTQKELDMKAENICSNENEICSVEDIFGDDSDEDFVEKLLSDSGN